MLNEFTLFLQDTNLVASMLLSRNSSLSTWPELSGVFSKQRNQCYISSNKCQVSSKCYSPISITIVDISAVKKSISSSLDKRHTFNYSAYDEILQGTESYGSNIKTMKQ